MPKRLLTLLFLLVLLFPSVAPVAAAHGMPATSSQSFRSSSVMFIENVGQFAEGARFLMREPLPQNAVPALFTRLVQAMQIASPAPSHIQEPPVDNKFPQLSVPEFETATNPNSPENSTDIPFTGAKQIAVGGFHTCALTNSGAVQCWGDNLHGQLAQPKYIVLLADQPTNASGLHSGVTAIAAGAYHTCALTSADGVKCWGSNDYGQLGDGTTIGRETPIEVRGLSSGVKAIAAGGYHTCALMNAGNMKCWGQNDVGQLGDGTNTARGTPVDVTGLSGAVRAMVTGGYHTCALTSTGGIKCWGGNRWGQLGDGTSQGKNKPVAVYGLGSGMSSVTAGWAYTCALSGGGGVACWGNNEYGQLGDGTTTDRWWPVTVIDYGKIGIDASEGAHTCAVMNTGGVKCWGENNFGQLGDGTTTDRWRPTDVNGLSWGINAVAGGGRHTCALRSNGGVQCWGLNYYGQLGDGTITNRWAPVNVIAGEPIPFDAAELASQSEYLTVAPGTAISPWIEVRNTGNTTWTQDQYGLNGKGVLESWKGFLSRNVAPGETQKLFWNLTAPTTAGMYDYGFMMRHGTQEFGPYFFVRVTVIGYTTSGRVVDANGAGISGVTVRADSSHTTTTDSIGNYTLSGLMPGIYTIQPSKNGYAFCPVDRRVNVSSNVAGQDFTGFGATVALGFCPDVNGYSFPNWGRGLFSAYDYRDTELIRMFGQDRVCVMDGPVCYVKPLATLWLRSMNFIMIFGHCDGMASTSLRFFKGKDIPQTFNPNASTAHALNLDDVRYHIAYYMVEQFTEPVSAYKDQILQNTPSAILDQLRVEMQGGADPPILFLRMAGEGGHTITPYAIEDKGNGISWVRVYDNNHPDDFTRYVIIDTVNQTWYYRAGSTTTWSGTTGAIGIVPISVYAEKPRPPWGDGSLQGTSPDTPSMQEVLLNGPGHLLITDAQGRRLGYSGAQFVSEIPGAYGGFIDGGLGVELEPIYRLPVNSDYTVLLDGQTINQPENVTVSQFGPDYAAQVDNIRLLPTVRDSITIAADGSQITYQPNADRSPTLSLALDDATASYALEVVGAEISAGQRVAVAAQETTGRLVYSNAQASGGEYGLLIRRVSQNGAQSFVHNALTVDAGDTHYADYRNWDGQGSMTLLIDRGSDGTIDETRLLTNDIKRVYLPMIRR